MKWLNLGYLKLNKPSEMYSITAFYRQSNGQEQVWVILSLPNKQNNEQFLFHIVDMWNFQFQTLVSNNPDDNINRTCFALYSKQQQLIVGLDVKGNVYVWNALNFTDFKYKIQITQYQCLNSIIGTLNDLANGIYLIVECGDFQVISFNVVTGQTQQIIKLGSINDYIQFIQEIQLLLVYQYSTAGDIFTYLFKPSTGTFEYFMKIRVNQHLDHVINFTYLPESQMLWIQYFYADAFFEIGKCLNDPSKCLNCSIDYYFNTDESQQVDQLYGQGTIDLPFLTSKSIMSAFYDAKKYSELLYGIQNIQLNINVNPQNSMNLVQELLNIDFGAVITLNIKSMDPNNQSQVNIQNGLELQNYYSIKLDTLKLNFTIQTNGNNAAANQCGINLTNVQYSILNNLDYISSNASVNCFQIYVKNSSITISNTTIDKRNFSDVNQLISIENSNQLLNSILNYQFSILVQKSDTNLFIDNMVIQNNTCSSYAINPPQSVGQLFQVGQSQVSNLFIKNNSFCNQKIFSTIGNINQNNLQFIFQNITLQQNKFYIQAPYIFFNAIYYFNAVPQHNLQVQNVFSQDNIYNPTEKPNQEVSIQSTSLFFTNQINNITIQNITVQNQFEIAFSIIQLSNYVNLYNLTYKNDQEFQDNRKNNYFGGFLQFSEIQQFTLNLLNVYSINAVDNSIISINIQQYRNINMMFQNVEISNCLFNQTQSNTHSNPILITSQYYSKIQIEQCQFHDNQLIGQINSFTQSTTGFQIVSPLSDVYIQKTFFTNSKSNTLYNFAYLQCNNSYISNSIFTNSSYDLQDPISQFKQEGGFFRAKLNKLIVNNTQFINSTASKGSFLYIEPLSNSLSVYFNQTSFMQGYASMQGSAFYIDSQNSILLLNCYQCNFTNIYSFSSQSQAISIQYTETQSTILQNGIIFNNCYLTNILGQQNNYFINSVNSVLQFQGITQTQNKDLKFPQQLIDQVQNLQSQAIIQSRNSNILIQKSSFSNLYNLPNQISPLFINSTNSDLNLTNVIIQSSNFSQSLINFDLGQINIQKSQFVNISKVEKSRLLQDQQSNLVSQNYSMLILQNSNMQISDQTLFENISCYSNCYGSSINLINSTFQINETRFIHSIAEAGGAIFIQGLTSNKNTINNSSFLNNQAMKDGGALYIHAFKEDTFQLNIISSIFKDNQCNEGQGGAIMIKSDSNNSTQQSIYINNSFFSENQAQIGGAIQNLGIHPFIDSSNIIKNNIANLYGSDISSYPTSLFLQNQAELKDNGSFQKIILNDFKSGGNLPNFIFQLRDGSNKTVIQQNNQILSAQVQVSSKTQNSTQYYVRGNSQINIDQAKHIFNFSNLQLIGIPKSSSVIQFTSDSIKIYNNYTNQYDSNYTFDVYVNFRNCQTGEIINKYNNFQECQTCENGKYSLDYTSCYPCPNGAQCSNGIINLESGFWREEEFSPDIFECINRKENCVQSSFGNSVCVTGNIGPLCEECDIYGKFWGESYTRQSKYQCTKCKSIKSDLWKLFLSVLWIFISLHITVRNDREYQLSKILIQSIIRKRPVSNSSMSYLLRNILIQKSYIKIFTNYIQIISIVASFNLNFKSDLLDFASALGIPVSTSIDFFDCFLKDLNSQVPIIYIKLIISIQVILVVLIVYAFWQKIKQVCIERAKKYDIYTLYTAFIFLFMFLQPDLVQQMIGLVSCRQIGNTSYILINMNYECNSKEYNFYSSVLVLPLLFLWVFVIPCLLFFQLYSYRRKLGLDNFQVNLKYGYLYKEYQKNVYYWEFIKINQKIFIIIVVSFYSQDLVIKGVLSYSIIMVYDYLARRLQPYSLKQLNQIDNYSTKVCSYTILLCIVQSGSKYEYLQILSFIIIIIINAWFILFIIFKVLQQRLYYLKNLIQNSKYMKKFFSNFQYINSKNKQIRKPLKLKIQKALLTFSSFSKDQKQFLLSLYQTQENRIQIGQTSDQNKLLQTKNTKSNYLEQFFQDNKIKSLNSPQSHSYLLNLDLSKSPYFFNKNVGLKENIISQENIPICQKDFFTTEKDQKNEMNFSNLIYQAHLAKINQESLFQSHSYQNQLLNKADKSSANQQGESNIQLNQIQYINDSESQKDRTQPMNVTQTIKYFKDNQNMGVDQEQKEHQLSTFSSQKQSKVVSNKQNPFNQFSKIQQIQADNEDEILINEKEQKTQTNQLIQTHQTFKTNQEINTESNYDKKESIVKVNEIEHIQDTEQLKDSIQPFNQSGQIQRLETKQIQEIDLILNKNKIDALNQQNQCLKKQNEQNPFNDFSKINQIQADIDDDILIASQNIVEEKQV